MGTRIQESDEEELEEGDAMVTLKDSEGRKALFIEYVMFEFDVHRVMRADLVDNSI